MVTLAAKAADFYLPRPQALLFIDTMSHLSIANQNSMHFSSLK